MIEQQKLVNAQQTTDIRDLKTKVDTKALFTAYLSSSVTVSSGHVLVFDKLRTSVGGGYSNTTGIFTAPVSGYYVFEFHIIGSSGKHGEFYLKHNNNNMVWIIVY